MSHPILHGFRCWIIALSFAWVPCLAAKEPESAGLVTLVDKVHWKPTAETFVITHGMGGFRDNDRFDKLAQAIATRIPDANVVVIDWSEASSATTYGLPSPWKVAARINDVAADAGAQLRKRGIPADRLTLIGESFGSYVNHRIAESLGGVKHLLAFNAASEAGGYRPPDLRRCAKVACSFQTYSPYDTASELAHHDFFLETPANRGLLAQHTYGVVWLTARINEGDRTWLLLDRALPARKPGAYCGMVTLTGDILDVAVDRAPDEPTSTDSPNAEPLKAIAAR